MSTTYSVVIPDDTFPGDNIVIEVDEQEYEILVPDGSAPGDTLQVELPEARNNQRRRKSSKGTEQSQRPKQRNKSGSRGDRSNSWLEQNHPSRSAPPPKEPLWLDVALVAGDEQSLNEWACIHIYEPRRTRDGGKEWVQCTSKGLWEQIKYPANKIRISPVPECSRFLIKVSGKTLEELSLEVSPNTLVEVSVCSTQSRVREQQQRRQQQQQQRSSSTTFPPTISSEFSSNASVSPPRRMTRTYSQQSNARIDSLTKLSSKVDLIQSKIDGFEKAVRDGTASGAQLSTIQDALAQCYGNLEKLQFTEIDAVVTGDLITGKGEAKSLRKSLSKRTASLLNIVEGLVNEIKQRKGKK
jgi:hypothetical protein